MFNTKREKHIISLTVDPAYLYNDFLYLLAPPHLSLCVCLPVARRRCVRERLPRWFSRWWTEQMAVSSALDTPSWVTLTHKCFADYKIRACSACESSLGCVSDRRCVSLSLACLSTGPHLSQRKKRISVCWSWKHSQSALCFCLPFSLFNPPEAVFLEKLSLKKKKKRSGLLTAHCNVSEPTHTRTTWLKQRPTAHVHRHTDVFLNSESTPVVFIPVHAALSLVACDLHISSWRF